MGSAICKRPGMLSSEWNQPKPLRLDHRVNLRVGAPRPKLRDLRTLGEFGRSQSLIGMGRAHEAMAIIDEFMVGVTSGEVSPIVAGLVYCGVIGACQETFDLRRAHERTEALTKWCAEQPDLIPYRGQCLVHRAEFLQMHGAWHEALDEATRARDQLFGSALPSVISNVAWIVITIVGVVGGERL